MMDFQNLFLVLLIALCTVSLKLRATECKLGERDSLIYSQVLCRHGNRNPGSAFGKYAENYDKIWPEGPMQLNELGKAEALDIGRFLRQRYAGFLSEFYKPDEIFVLSSAIDRTIKTAQMCTYGLYTEFCKVASRGRLLSKDALPFEPVPIRTIPSELDNVLNMHPNCPRRIQSVINFLESDFARSHFQNDSAIEYILQHAGYEVLNPNGTFGKVEQDLFVAIELIITLYEQNKTLEDWMVPLISDERFLTYIYGKCEMEQAQDLATHRLNVGALWELIVRNINGRLKGTHKRKLEILVGHDRNLLSLGLTLGINSTFENRMPPPASCLLLEFHDAYQQEQEGVTVEVRMRRLSTNALSRTNGQLWYRKSSESAQRVVSSSCGDPCTLSRLLNITAEVMNVDYDKECQLD